MKLLHIDSSILGDNSASRQLSHDVVEAWKAAEADVMVTYRDLAADAISHFSAQTLIAAGTSAELRDAAQKHERSEEHTSEIQSLMRTSYAVFCLKKKQTQPRRNNT